jgi:tetratricopeptide (TPR) repeat protein
MDFGDRKRGETYFLKYLTILALYCFIGAAHAALAQDTSAGRLFQVRRPDSAERAMHLSAADSAARVARAKELFAKGNQWLAKGQRDSARVAYEGAVTLDHHNVDAIVALAHLLVADGHAGNARVLLGLALKSNPNDPRLLHFKAVRDTAGLRYDSLLAEPTPSEETYRAAASQALGMGLYPRASDIVVRGLAQYPHSTTLRALADSARKIGDRQQ